MQNKVKCVLRFSGMKVQILFLCLDVMFLYDYYNSANLKAYCHILMF